MKYTPAQIGKLIRDTRKRLGVTQKDLALTSGTGLRFIIDLEKGKETCEIGKALTSPAYARDQDDADAAADVGEGRVSAWQERSMSICTTISSAISSRTTAAR